MVSFPSSYSDLNAFRNNLQLPLNSTNSDAAAKMLDASLTQFALFANDDAVGDMEQTMAKAVAEDPDCILTQAWMLQLSNLFVPKPIKKCEEEREKALILEKKALEYQGLSKWEMLHVKAALATSKGQMQVADSIWGQIIKEWPSDMFAYNMLFYSNLLSGCKPGLRDNVIDMLRFHDEKSFFHGNLLGRLCFGYEENNQFDLAIKSGQKALIFSPKDAFAVHGIVHAFHETSRLRECEKLLDSTSNWWSEQPFAHHLYWHQSLLLLDLHEDADRSLAIIDDNSLKTALTLKTPIALSDGVSFLFRLLAFFEEDAKIRQKVAKDFEILAKAYLESPNLVTGNLFFDFHAYLVMIVTERRAEAVKIKEEILDSVKDLQTFNGPVMRFVAEPLISGLDSFFDGEFEKVTEQLLPIRYHLRELMAGSHMQNDVFDILLLAAAAKSGQKQLVESISASRATRNRRFEDNTEEGNNSECTVYDRMAAKMAGLI